MAPLSFLVTGSAGFIGSHLVEHLLRLGHSVAGLDNFATGHRANLDEVAHAVGAEAWRRHRFLEASIVDPEACRAACRGVDIVLHQAALGSVPRSIADPVATHQTNVTGFVNMLVAARDAGVRRFVYASSSSVHGEGGRPLSPYAASKQVNELYAEVFGRCYGMQTVGLRYYNVFGPRQDPEGAYAAVIPRWIRALLTRAPVEIYGDGETSRDFCYIANAVQANLLAAHAEDPRALNRVYNISVGQSTSLNQLFQILRSLLGSETTPLHRPFRSGDVRHSLADIGPARSLLAYEPSHSLARGLAESLSWYVDRFAAAPA